MGLSFDGVGMQLPQQPNEKHHTHTFGPFHIAIGSFLVPSPNFCFIDFNVVLTWLNGQEPELGSRKDLNFYLKLLAFYRKHSSQGFHSGS